MQEALQRWEKGTQAFCYGPPFKKHLSLSIPTWFPGKRPGVAQIPCLSSLQCPTPRLRPTLHSAFAWHEDKQSYYVLGGGSEKDIKYSIIAVQKRHNGLYSTEILKPNTPLTLSNKQQMVIYHIYCHFLAINPKKQSKKKQKKNFTFSSHLRLSLFLLCMHTFLCLETLFWYATAAYILHMYNFSAHTFLWVLMRNLPQVWPLLS